MLWALRQVTGPTRFDTKNSYQTGTNPKEGFPMMFRWIIVVFLALVLISWLFSMRLPWLEKLGLTKLSSNLRFTLFGRVWQVPITLAIVLSAAVYLAANLIFKWM